MQLIVEGPHILEKFPGKGGWTYVKISGELITTGKAFGMMEISGSLDNITFESKHLMPMGNGYVFLPVAKPIRTALGKEEGDEVFIRFFRKEIPNILPQELVDCLNDDPGKLELFEKLPKEKQQHWIEHIYETGNIEARTARIIRLLASLQH
ncbi:YdeI/OmpD-associated family protein [Algoriphagus sp.]|uniref:YdeI/OmpD-associated family protein n=1 Tax=Algoriphagus sp. TaxID=1872435 RepID=UPI00326C7C32